MAESPYPEHDKLHEVVEVSQAIGEFLDMGLPAQGICLAEHNGEGWLVPCRKAITTILAEYFNIDQDAIEREKRAMLDESERWTDD